MSTKRSSILALTLVAAVSLLLAGAAAAATTTPAAKDEPKEHLDLYLVISPHAPSQHLKVLEEMAATEPQILESTEWGRVGPDEVGYTMVDAKDANAAKSVVPEEVRARAQAVRLTRYTPDEVKALHKNPEGNASIARK